MRIGIDARALAPPLTGIGNYFSGLLSELARIGGSTEFFLYSPDDFNGMPSSPYWKKRVRSGRGKLTYSSPWMYTVGRQMMIQDRLDLFWAPWPTLPPFLPMRKVITVHDLVWKLYPSTMHNLIWLLFNTTGGASIRSADAIFAVSHATQELLQQFYPASRRRVYLTPNAASAGFCPLDREKARQQVADKYKTGLRFILTVGTLEPRKNIENLLRAFARLRREDTGDVCLVVVGAKGWKESAIFSLYRELQLQDRVIFLGYVPGEDLPLIYNAAEVFIFPSLYEGFGIPPLEAMACGTPVIVSDRPAMPEVVGEAGLYVDPLNIDDIAAKINRLLNDVSLWRSLSEKGLIRARQFSWASSAGTVMGAFREIVRSEGTR